MNHITTGLILLVVAVVLALVWRQDRVCVRHGGAVAVDGVCISAGAR